MRVLLRKLLGLVLTLLLVSLVTFAVFQILPGDPATVILGVDADPVQLERLREQMGVNDPLPQRFASWLLGVLRGDLGTSYRYSQPVSELIANGLSVTLSLSLLSLLFTVLIGLPAGIFLAQHKKKITAAPVSFLVQLGLSTPTFCVSILLISLFSVKLRWLPSFGYVPFAQDPLGWLRSLLLPSLSTAFGTSAVLCRYVQAGILQQEREDYVRTAKSKGVPQSAILRRHVLRNALIPVLTIFGMLAADVLGGSIIVETVFSLPGIGKLIAASIATRDLPLIQGLVLYLAAAVAVCNFAVDVLYTVIDPRIRRR